jgi:hypothetical protein
VFECPNCSNHLPDGATFCSQCWQEVSGPAGSGDEPTIVLPNEGRTAVYGTGAGGDPADPTVISTPPSYGPQPSAPPPSFPPPDAVPSYDPVYNPNQNPYGPPPSAQPSYAPPSGAPSYGPPPGYPGEGPPPAYQPAPPPPGAAPPPNLPPPNSPPPYGYGPAPYQPGAGYGPYPMGPGWSPPFYPPAPSTNTMAVLSLVMAAVAFMSCGITAIPAVVFGHIGLYQLKRADRPEQGRGLAIAGLVLGYLFILGGIGFILLMALADSGSSDY